VAQLAATHHNQLQDIGREPSENGGLGEGSVIVIKGKFFEERGFIEESRPFHAEFG